MSLLLTSSLCCNLLSSSEWSSTFVRVFLLFSLLATATLRSVGYLCVSPTSAARFARLARFGCAPYPYGTMRMIASACSSGIPPSTSC